MCNRIRAAAANRSHVAKPNGAFANYSATVTAICREASYAQFTPLNGRLHLLKIPPVGTVLLILAYLVFILILQFINNNVDGGQHFTSLGVRAGWLAVAQVPLLILLAGKNNLIGLVSGISYERLNVLHRWASRALLFLATLHVIFLHKAWNAYDLGPLEYATDSCIPTGWAVYAILLWMNVSTIVPLRALSYEFFVVQHILTFFGFIIAVMFHLPDTALYSRVYIFIPIGLYILDRLIRTARYAYNNVRPAYATLTALDGGVTKITVKNRSIKSWTPASHVFISIPALAPGQSHPATIASTSTSHSGDLVFILKSHKGFTKRLLNSASSASSITSLKSSKESSVSDVQVRLALIDGPYGASHSDFAAFDTVLLIAGSTGCTFTLPILLDIASRAQKSKIPVRHLTYIWIVKNTSWTNWISKELQSAFEMLREAGIEIEIKIFVTCDDNFTSLTDGDLTTKEMCCDCDKSLGPCCCIVPESPRSSDTITPTASKSEVDEKAIQTTVKSASSISSVAGSGRALARSNFQSGRPDFEPLLWNLLEQAEGETAVGVCGPTGLNACIRTTVAKACDDRAVHKGTGAQGVYLHVEGFGW
jgi:ferric-chelate reductase